MPRFLQRCYLAIADRSNQWVTVGALVYLSDIAQRTITVDEGFETDLASIPRSFHWLIPVNGKHRLAAIIHDWLYAKAPDWCTRKLADQVLLEAMKALGESWWRRTAMYSAVRAGGWLYWRKCRECKHSRVAS